MLTSPQAEKIVRDCIRSASGFGGSIGVGKKLSEVGIVDDDAKRALNDEIVTNRDIGVQSQNHRLGPQDLDFTISTKVFELRDQVSDKATPIQAPAKGFAKAGSKKSESFNEGVRAGKKSARKGAKTSAKKGAKKGSKKGAKKR